MCINKRIRREWGKRLHLHDGDNGGSGASVDCPSLLSVGASNDCVIP
jgi:hypothetical protein